MVEVNIDGIVTWLKSWFYDKTEMNNFLNAKANLNQSVANQNVVTDASGNISTEAKPTIDNALSTSSPRAVKNSAITTAINGLDTRITALEGFELVEVVAYNQWDAGNSEGVYYHPEEASLNKLYIVPKSDTHTNDGYSIYVVAKNGNTYSWEKVDDFDLNFDDLLEDADILDSQVVMTDGSGNILAESGVPISLYTQLGRMSALISTKGVIGDDIDWSYNSNGFTNGIKLVSKTDNANGRITIHRKTS